MPRRDNGKRSQPPLAFIYKKPSRYVLYLDGVDISSSGGIYSHMREEEMKKLCYAILAISLLVFLIPIHGQTNKRIAIIEDSSGVITEVVNLKCGSGDSIPVITETFTMIIPIENLISIKREDETEKKVFLVKYYWAGKERTIAGQFGYTGGFTGESDFGAFSMGASYYALKQITFNQDAEKGTQKEVFNPDGYLLLRNGDHVEFKDLRRTVLSETKRKEVIDPLHYAEVPAGTYETQYKNFAFDRGESSLILDFKDIGSIVFGDEVTGGWIGKFPMTITLKNGNSTSGDFKRPEPDLQGDPEYTGWLESGEFRIVRSKIKAIHFTTK